MFLLFTIYLIVYCKKGVCQHFETPSLLFISYLNDGTDGYL